MHSKLLLALPAMLPLLSSAARASDCETVAAAYEKLGTLPAVRQLVSSGGPTELESIMLGDTLYLKSDGEWTEMKLKPGQRAALFSQLFDKLSITECTPAGSETLDGRATAMFDYEVPAMGGMPADTQRVWIGADDGLPHQMQAKSGTKVVLSFNGIEAPAK